MTRAVAVGFRARTGRAIAVALAGPASAPELLWRRETALVDPAMPETAQPYHEVMQLPWDEALVAVRPAVTRIEAVARKALAAIARDLAAQGCTLRTIGVVGSPDRPLEKIGNFHIRAHAAEGILFRSVLELAAKHIDVPCRTFSEKQVAQRAQAELTATADVDVHLKELGRRAGPPWRTLERAAAMAAWLALSASVRSTRRTS
jgi:hypothetical protein